MCLSSYAATMYVCFSLLFIISGAALWRRHVCLHLQLSFLHFMDLFVTIVPERLCAIMDLRIKTMMVCLLTVCLLVGECVAQNTDKTIRYNVAELRELKSSPLVCRPDP